MKELIKKYKKLRRMGNKINCLGSGLIIDLYISTKKARLFNPFSVYVFKKSSELFSN